ncbi:MAG: CheR family methyltransferase [Candidatus Omnitrophota bacterium]
MENKPRNIIEDIAKDQLEKAVSLRYDICVCNICKNDMLAYALSRLPPKYATTDQGAMHTIIENTRPERENEISRVIMLAIEMISKNPRHKLIEDKEKAFELLLTKIFQERGINFRNYHREILKRRFALRIRSNNLHSYSEYLRFLFNNPAEYEDLFELLYINISEFFRDQEVWVTLRYLFENLIKIRRQERNLTLKIWSAGCAGGEEPYSIAIILKELLGDKINDFKIELNATDIDKRTLESAIKGRFDKTRNKNIPKNILEKYFLVTPSNYILRKEIVNMVNFKFLDLITEDLLLDNDLICCRNVFIYFNRALQGKIVDKFHKALKPGGYLVLGKVETILTQANNLFDEIDQGAHIYSKK